MNEHNWRRVKELFHEAAARPLAERRDFLREACGGDAPLCAEVEELLTAHDQAGGNAGGSPDAPDPSGETVGTSIGPYKLLQQIGEGGFGIVYMAEQTQPVRRIVALKIIRLGMDTRQVIARFEAERQALALMDHPNIARVLDAGSTASGRPYFVMELVKGVPITRYCDSNHLSTRARLELFVRVCHAVRHAHQKGIIHRDLKPSNVMVTLHDGVPVPKVIDFGIAKATGARLTDKTLFTEFRQFMGTPEYMSPEQAEMSGLDIDTRADIYSLGVLLYELLTGTTPFDARTLRESAFDEIVRIIREEEPQKPSTRVSTLGERSLEVAKDRGAEPKALHGLLLGDLDWIVMKALEKDRTRRYESADGLALDVERHLHDEPVSASPPSTVYRLRKYARRHRTMLAAFAAVGAALLLGLAAATWGLLRARHERDHALAAEHSASHETERVQKVNSFLQRFLTATSTPWSPAPGTRLSAFGPDVKVVDVVDDLVQSLEAELANEPEIEAEVRFTIGDSYLHLSRDADAETQIRRALELRQRISGGEDLETMQGLTQLAAALSGQGRQDEAQPYLRRGIDGRRRLAGERSLDTLEAEQNIVWWLMDKSEDEPEAEPLARHLVELDREIRGMDARETLEAQATLAFMLIEAGKLDEGDALARETLAAVQRTFGEQDHLCGFLEIVLGNSALDRGDPVAAEGLFRDALEFARRFGEGELFGGAIAALRLSLALGGQGRWAEAEALAREAGSTFLRIGGTSIFTVGAFTYLGIALVAQGKNAEAEDAYRQLVDLCAHSPDPDRPEAINASRLLAQHLVRMGKSAEAEPFARAVVEACRRVSTAQPEDAQAAARLVRSLGTWASVLADLGRGAEADQSFREARKICDESLLGDDEGTLDTLESLAILLDGQGRSVEAEPLSRRILDGRRRTLGEQHPNTLLAQNNLAWILYRLGRSAEAEPLARAAVEGGRHVSLSPPNRVAQLDTLASILTDLGRLDEAEALFTEIEGLQSDGPDRLRPDPEIMIRHAECLLALERPDEAEQRLLDAHALLISQGLGHSPAARTAAQRLSELYAGRGRTGEAQVWLDKLAGNSAGS